MVKCLTLVVEILLISLTVEYPEGTQYPRYRGCLPVIFYGTEAIKVRSHINAGHSTVKQSFAREGVKI